MKKIIFAFILTVLFAQTIFANKNYSLYFGLEMSELLQNNFQNFGVKNYTFFLGQKFVRNYGYRIVLINVGLSNEHLKENLFIKGNKDNIHGNLFVSRGYLDFYSKYKNLFFIKFIPIISFGLGYENTILKNVDEYNLKTFSFCINFRLQYEVFSNLFLEFPVVDVPIFLWKNRDVKGVIGDAIIDFTDWGMIFLWINFGVKIKF